VTVKVAIKENLKECGFSQGLLYSRYNPGTAKCDWENHKQLQSGSYQGPPQKAGMVTTNWDSGVLKLINLADLITYL